MADEPKVAAEECTALGGSELRLETFANSKVMLGSIPVTRALPVKGRRLVGPWCFLDRFGPLTFGEEKPMDVAPHPHIGLQTVTWLLEGEVVHDDSLGCQATARPGGVNVMTAGAGIAHTEQTPPRNSHRLNGVQLWTALPAAQRAMAPSFAALDEVPVIESRAGLLHLFAGSMAGAVCKAPYFSPILGAELQVHPGQCLELDLPKDHEHAVLILQGDAAIEGQVLAADQLYYLAPGRSSLAVQSRQGCRLLLIGGLPFPEKILMWWNFVARTPEEIVSARKDWENHQRFGAVPSYSGPRIEAPELLRFAQPNPAS